MKLLKRHWYVIVHIIIILVLLILPYYLFQGKLFIGGDDTRLQYSYPFEYLKNVSFYSWYNVSSTGIIASNQQLIPFLVLWIALGHLLRNVVVLSYLSFSLPLILAFVYFQKFVKELFSLDNSYRLEILIGCLFFILSPIVIYDQLFIFLTTVWLLGLVPAVGYYYLRFLKTNKFIYVYISALLCFVLAVVMLSIPWIFGIILPLLGGGFVLILLSKRKDTLRVLGRSCVFFAYIVIAQSFCLLNFLAPYLVRDRNSFAVKFLAQDFLNSFAQTVLGTASGTIIYPLVGLFHRQIAFDFRWKLEYEFIKLFDKTLLLDGICLIVLALGIFSYKRYLADENRKLYLALLVSFILSLFLFTVNIGPLKNVFLFLGHVPGFVMFRNFYDKFAPGYIFIYASLITISLVLIKKKFPRKYVWINLIIILVTLMNFTTIKATVNSPLWTTRTTYKTITIPKEYLDFMHTIQSNISPSNTILSLPFGASVYTVIKDDTSNNVYLGISPVKIFSGVNDISGSYSFNFSKYANIIDSLMIARNYDELNRIYYNHNINYIMVTKNVPKEVLGSYNYNQDTLPKEDAAFLKAISGKKILTSENGNYELYTTKKQNTILNSKNLTFEKINSVTYKLSLKNIAKPQVLQFNDSYHVGWKLYPVKNSDTGFCTKVIHTAPHNISECKSNFRFFSVSEMSYLWKKSQFDESHTTNDGSMNSWKIDPTYIKRNFSKDEYTVNKDGSINLELTMYFKPQLYFYYGLILTILVFAGGALYLFISYLHEKHRN